MFESVGFRLFNLAGVESPRTHWTSLRIVDEKTGAPPKITLVGKDSNTNDCGNSVIACYTYAGTISDTGTAVGITGHASPGALDMPIKGSPSARIAGLANVTFHASSNDWKPHALARNFTPLSSSRNVRPIPSETMIDGMMRLATEM